MARIVLAKLGSDAHDAGVTVVAHWLRQAGHEVIYAGLYNTPERVAEVAAQEDADLVGVSCLSVDAGWGGRRMMEALRDRGLPHVPVVVGGVVTPEMRLALARAGVAGVFGPGSRRDTVLTGVRAALAALSGPGRSDAPGSS